MHTSETRFLTQGQLRGSRRLVEEGVEHDMGVSHN